MKQPATIQYSLTLPLKGPPVLATGDGRQNTLCISRDDQAFVTRSLGDLDSEARRSEHEIAATELMVWQAVIPAVIARDLDPDMHSTRYAIELSSNLGISHVAVQHHHAHVAAVCAEHGIQTPVIGLVLDGRGMGSDGACWGGELLHVDGASFERVNHLAPMTKPGGNIAIHETWRMAVGVFHVLQRQAEIPGRFQEYPAATDLVTMLADGRNCPQTTCAELLLLTAAYLLRLTSPTNDHQMMLSALERAATSYYGNIHADLQEPRWIINKAGQLDLYPVLDYLIDETDIKRGAAYFHANLIAGAAEWAASACAGKLTQTVVLAGACMSNRLLAAGLRSALEQRGLTVYEAQQLPPDDSAIALGQAWVALNSLRSLAP